jgi:DNA-binding MarR family transcriptional regulator
VVAGALVSNDEGAHHPRHDLDETIHQPVRFSIVAMLYHAERADFGFLRRHVDVTESNLSRHLAALEEAGYVLMDKVFERKRARTWLSLTAAGRAAFEGHIDALNRIVGRRVAASAQRSSASMVSDGAK